MNKISLLVDALFKRGFLVIQEKEGFRLSLGSHTEDEKSLLTILDEFNIDYLYNSNCFTLDNDISEEQQHSILLYPARNHESNIGNNYGTWRNFTRRKHGPKTSTITLESGIATLVKSLSAIGISTISSCDGHGVREPRIDFASDYNAIWFEYIQDIYLKGLPLTYNWVVKHNVVGPYLSVSGNKFNVLNLQEDSAKIAGILLKHDKEIRELKQIFFAKNKKPTKRLLHKKNYEENKEILSRVITTTMTILA